MYEIGNEYIMEAEAVKLPIEGSEICIPVMHLVLQPEYISREAEVITRITNACRERLKKHEMPEGFKIRTDFATNEVSAKRDYVLLKNEREHYYIADMGGTLLEVSFDIDGRVTKKSVEPSEIIIATTI
jgi:hypothetical protein